MKELMEEFGQCVILLCAGLGIMGAFVLFITTV